MHNLSEWQSDLQSYVKAFHMGSETLRHLSNDSKADQENYHLKQR